MDRLDVMRMYCQIVEKGQLSLAAKELNLSKGTVSKQLSKLEAELGGRLLNRTTRRLAPTEIGIVYYERVKQILESVNEANAVVGGLNREPQGTLRLNAPMAFGSHHLGKLLAEYYKRYPKVKVDLTLADRQVDIVEEGYDIVLRISALKSSSLIMRRLAPCAVMMCASPGYLEGHPEPQIPEDLKHHDCLTYAYAESTKYWSLENGKGEKKKIAVSGPLQANNGYLLRDAVEAGMGIALLPYFIVSDLIESGRIKVVLNGWGPKPHVICLLYPSSKHLSAKVRAFLDVSVEFFKGKF